MDLEAHHLAADLDRAERASPVAHGRESPCGRRVRGRPQVKDGGWADGRQVHAAPGDGAIRPAYVGPDRVILVVPFEPRSASAGGVPRLRETRVEIDVHLLSETAE